MALGGKTLTGAGPSAAIVAADPYRDYIVIQAQSDHSTYLGFGEAAISGQGLCLLEPGATVTARGPKARLAINGISAGDAVLGFETCESVEYRSGQFAGPWPLT